ALTFAPGPQLATESMSAPPRSDSVSVPALQPLTLTLQAAPEPVGTPILQPVAVPERLRSSWARPLTGPPNLIEYVNDPERVGERGELVRATTDVGAAVPMTTPQRTIWAALTGAPEAAL